jgi:hypothetical protein
MPTIDAAIPATVTKAFHNGSSGFGQATIPSKNTLAIETR